MVLAGGNDQAALIRELRKQVPDVYVILIDMLKDVVAAPYADKQYVISTMDLPAVKKCALEEKVDYIMTACGDQPLLTMAVVSEELGLPCYLSKSQVLNLTNKKYMKQLMLESGIPTTRFRTFSDIKDVSDEGLSYPIMVKPVDSNGSKGVRKVLNRQELLRYAQPAFDLSLSHTIIVEEFAEGTEISLDYYVTRDKVQCMMSSKLNKYRVDDSTQVIYQSIIPSGISENVQKKLDLIAAKIAQAYEVDNSPLLIQAMVDGDKINVIEFSARLGGGAKYKTIQMVTGFDVLSANLQSMMGKKPKVSICRADKCYSRVHLYTSGGIFNKIEGTDAMLASGVIMQVIVTRSPGAVVNSPKSSSDRVGSFFVSASSFSELEERIDKVLNTITVLDKDGEDILKREIYSQRL